VDSILYHANTAEREGISQASFLQSFPRSTWIKWANFFEYDHQKSVFTDDMSVLYALAVSDMSHLLQAFPSILTCLETGSERYGPPLIASIAAESRQAFEVFLHAFGLDLQAKKHALNLFDENHRLSQPTFDRSFNFVHKERDIFWYLADFGSHALLSYALENINVELHAIDKSLQGPLLRAVQRGHVEIVRFLITTYHVNINGKTIGTGSTPLMEAVDSSHIDIVQLLLGTDNIELNTTDYGGNTALMRAAGKHSEQLAKLLLSTGKAEVNAKNNMGITALMQAVTRGAEETVALLLTTDRIEVNAKDKSGVSALFLAGDLGRTTVVEMLLRTRNIDVNIKTNVKVMPLMLAALQGHRRIVELLLSTNRVEIDAEDCSGFTAMKGARLRGHDEILKLLQDARNGPVNGFSSHVNTSGTGTGEQNTTGRKRGREEFEDGQEDTEARKRIRLRY
jgi:ankyrin repeat protein